MEDVDAMAAALVTHRRRAIEALREVAAGDSTARERARDHLIHAAALLTPLRGLECDQRLVALSRAMASALTMVVSRRDDAVSDAATSLRGVGCKLPQLRVDTDGAEYDLEAFAEYYGQDNALARFDESKPSNQSFVYSKFHLRMIRASLNLAKTQRKDAPQWSVMHDTIKF